MDALPVTEQKHFFLKTQSIQRIRSQNRGKVQSTIAADIQLLQINQLTNVRRDPFYHVVTQCQLPKLKKAIQPLQIIILPFMQRNNKTISHIIIIPK